MGVGVAPFVASNAVLPCPDLRTVNSMTCMDGHREDGERGEACTRSTRSAPSTQRSRSLGMLMGAAGLLEALLCLSEAALVACLPTEETRDRSRWLRRERPPLGDRRGAGSGTEVQRRQPVAAQQLVRVDPRLPIQT